MHEKDPVISVIMGIYNCGDTLSEAIECIVNQTFSDWELIMCDDGSNDDTYEIAISYKEKYPEKIIVLQNEKNRGLNYTLNKCLKQAKGKEEDAKAPGEFRIGEGSYRCRRMCAGRRLPGRGDRWM